MLCNFPKSTEAESGLKLARVLTSSRNLFFFHSSRLLPSWVVTSLSKWKLV